MADPSAIEQVEHGAETLMESLQQLQTRSIAQGNSMLEKEVNLFLRALPEMVNLFKENLPVTTSGQAPAIDSLMKKLKKTTDFVQSCSQDGFFRSRWSPYKPTEELELQRQDLGDTFLLTLVHATLDHVSSAGKKQDLFNSRMKEIAESVTGKGNKHRRSATADEDDEFRDPITFELMCDPVKGSDGHTYDRWTIIDNDMTQSPFDQRKEKIFSIACDDINVRGRLFERFPSSGVQEKFHERRESYRDQALLLARAGSNELDVEVLKMLDHVLKWAEDDLECQLLRDSIAERVRGPRASRSSSVRLPPSGFPTFGSGRRDAFSSSPRPLPEITLVPSRVDQSRRQEQIPTRDETGDQIQNHDAYPPGCFSAIVILIGVGLCYILSCSRRKKDD